MKRKAISNLAPIALFVFNRLTHTQKTLEYLAENPEFLESPLIIFCDGSRNQTEAKHVEKVRECVRDWIHPNKMIVERGDNFGLAKSIISGVTQVCEDYGRVIVLEDDMITSPFFLRYMNSSLVKFQEDDRVISIHGYSYPIDNLPEAYFLLGASCWGWATWKRGWDLFDEDGARLYKKLTEKSIMKKFDVNGSYPYRRMLLDQIHGENDSWAIRWYASAFINQKLTLYPGRSLIYNTGLDGSGSNCDKYDGYNSNLSSTPIDISKLYVKENVEVFEKWHRFIKLARRKKALKQILSIKKVFEFIARRIRY